MFGGHAIPFLHLDMCACVCIRYVHTVKVVKQVILSYLHCLLYSVAANSAVYMSMTAFMFLLSVPILRERVTVLKVISVAIQIGGVFMVAYAKDQCPTPTHWSSLANETNATQNTSAFDAVLSKSGRGNPCDNNDTVLGYVVGVHQYIPRVLLCLHMQSVCGVHYSASPIFLFLFLMQFLLVSIFFYAFFEVFYKKFVALPGDTAQVPNAFRMIGLAGIHCLAYCW